MYEHAGLTPQVLVGCAVTGADPEKQSAGRGRLTFRPVRNPGELIELLTLVLDGTLDAHSRADLTRMTPGQAAQEQYHNELERYASPHEWWRIATLPDGEPIGFVIPAHNGYNPIIAYPGVVPAHRGHGHIHDVLAAGTALLAAQNVPRIRAATERRQRTDGSGLRAGRLHHLRAPGRHDLAMTGRVAAGPITS
jgi:hypothetical protein